MLVQFFIEMLVVKLKPCSIDLSFLFFCICLQYYKFATCGQNGLQLFLWTVPYNLIFSVLFFKKLNGKEVAVLDGFTFCLASKRYLGRDDMVWKCSYGNKCKSRFTYANKKIYKCNIEHPHSAPKFIIKNKTFYKLWTYEANTHKILSKNNKN